MSRTSFHHYAQSVCDHNGVASLATPDIRAIVYVEPSGMAGPGANLQFLALLPDGRFRHGRLSIRGKGASPAGPTSLAHPGPRDAVSLAAALRLAIETRDAAGPASEPDRPFVIGGWSPWDPRGGSNLVQYLGRAEDAVLPWLSRTPLSEKGCFAEAWRSTLAGHVTPEQVDAAEAFSGIGAFDPAAFDQACGLTVAGERCRSFARHNAAIALAALSNPLARILVTEGEPLASVIEALSPDEPVLRPAYGDPKVRRNVLARISGAFTRELGHTPMAALILGALEALPLEWAPRTDADMAAFARLCRGTVNSYPVHLPGGVAPDWWRLPFAGSGGRWAAFADRVALAGMGPGREGWLPVDGVLKSAADRRGFVVEDLLRPLSDAYGASDLQALSGMPGTWMGSLRATGRSALHDFAHLALTEGMSLPAIADQGRRHQQATDAIREVCRRFPSAESASSKGPWASVGDPIPGLTYIPPLPQPYAVAAPGAIDAMVLAWQPVLPRRLRRLSARDLAAALDAEAARHRSTLPGHR